MTAYMKNIADALERIDKGQLEMLVKFESRLEPLLNLVNVCEDSVSAANALEHGCAAQKKKLRKGSWLMVMKTLYAKLHLYDGFVTLNHGKRKDGTWYASLSWDDCYYPWSSGYSLGGSWADGDLSHELAAKSLLKDFCENGPGRAEMAFDPAVYDRKRRANYSIAKLYEELDPKSPEDLAAKLGFQIKEKAR